MIARQTLEEFELDFLNEKSRPSRLDVAERMSVQIKQRGFTLAGLKRTGAQTRGSASEPIYLGSNYEDIVHHQWYTTRSAIAGRRPVDDVAREAISQSLEELFSAYQAEPREITVVVGVRVRPNEPQRLRNITAVLQALNWQDLARWRYRIIVVEQDRRPQLEQVLAPLADRYLFAYNPGPYNRGWAFNVGAMRPGSHQGVVCLIDGDLLAPSDFLSRGLAAHKAGHLAIHPYQEVLYLDGPSTERAIQDRRQAPLTTPNPTQPQPAAYAGQSFTTAQGGCIWVDADLYRQIGGHDERFRGWGYEDRAFWQRLAGATPIESLPGRLLHLDHPRPVMQDRWARANRLLGREIKSRGLAAPTRPIGDPNRYRSAGDGLPPEPAQDSQGPATGRPHPSERPWQNWDRWSRQRIEGILRHETRRQERRSARRRLAGHLATLGDSLLDVGCGPGALWPHLQPLGPGFSWMGLDVTPQMLAVAAHHFPQVPLVQGDAGFLPLVQGSFDVVLLRHLLEHLPDWLMERVLTEAMRIGRLAVVLAFHRPPYTGAPRRTRRVGENFLETRWAVADLQEPIQKAGWRVQQQLSLPGGQNGGDQLWVLNPAGTMSGEQRRPAGYRAVYGTPKISIIMPTYRRPHTVRRTVDTVLAQSYANWELIIVDNAGDGDLRFADPRIQVYQHAEQASASYARNQGLGYAQGDLICFFDDDDDMFSHYLARFAAAFQAQPQAKIVRGGMIVSDGRVNYSYATPECCLRREYATPSWRNRGPAQDQRYFRRIVRTHGWTETAGDIVIIREALCRANADPEGGLRSGNY